MPTSRRRRLPDKGGLLFIAGLLILSGVYFVIAVFAGRRLLLSGHMFPPDVLFGFDIDRAVRGISDPTFFYDRSNVHPLFAVFLRPFGLLVQRFGITPGMAAIMVNAGAGALALPVMAWYFRLRGAARIDAFLVTLLAASSTTWLIQSALPSTPIFSLLLIALAYVLLIKTLRQPNAELSSAARFGREVLWGLVGFLNYGITVTNGFVTFLIYGFNLKTKPWWRAWVRAVVFGAVVLLFGLLVSWATGATLDMVREKQWVGNKFPDRWPLMQSLATNFAWTMVSPIPHVGPTLDERGWLILSFIDWKFTLSGNLLMFLWGVLYAAALVLAWRERDAEARWLNGALLPGLVFHVLLHRWYVHGYEGPFLWNGHSFFMVMGLMASMMAGVARLNAGRQLAFRIFLALFALGLLAHNAHLLFTLGRMVPLPPGFSAVLPQ